MARDVSWRVPKRRLFSTTLPAQTRTYKPVSHKELATVVLGAIKEAGFELGVEEYYAAKEGKVATARYTINDVRDEDMQLEIGWQNSYDKSLSLKFAIGTRIMICENGCVSGNFGSFARKHMADVQTFAKEEMIASIISAGETFDKIKEEKDIMKRHIISKEKQYEIAGKLFFMNDSVGSTQLNIIKEQIKKPSFDYGAPNSLWEIYQHVTFSMKDLHPRLWMDAHIEVHKFFLNELNNNVNYLEIEADAKSFRNLKEFEETGNLPENEIELNDNQINILDVIEEEELKDIENE